MTSTTDYEVIVHREVYPEGSWWVFDIPAPGAAEQVTRLADVGPTASSIIAMWDEDGPDEADVHVTVRLEGEAEARRIWEQSEVAEGAARAALDRAAARRREAVALLRDEQHYSAADAAPVLG